MVDLSKAHVIEAMAAEARAMDHELSPEQLATLWRAMKRMVKEHNALYSTLFDHQLKNLMRWMIVDIATSHRSLMNNDDMGMGKTRSAIASMGYTLATTDSARVLVLAPSSLVTMWIGDIQKHLPHAAVSSPPLREIKTRRLAGGGILVVSHSCLKRCLPEALRDADAPWDLVVMDEAHSITNDASNTNINMFAIPAKRKLPMTGTPVSNSNNEMRALIDWTFGPELWQSRRFMRYVCNTTRSKQVELPPLTFHRLDVRLEDRRGVQCRNTTLRESAKFNRSVVVGRSNQRIGELGKVYVEHILKHGDPSIVFCQLLDQVKTLQKALIAHGVHTEVIMGSTDSHQRDMVVEMFRKRMCRVVIMTIKTGGVGLRLETARRVYMMNDYNPNVEIQAIARAHRSGDKAGPVDVYYPRYIDATGRVFATDEDGRSTNPQVHCAGLHKRKLSIMQGYSRDLPQRAHLFKKHTTCVLEEAYEEGSPTRERLAKRLES